MEKHFSTQMSKSGEGNFVDPRIAWHPRYLLSLFNEVCYEIVEVGCRPKDSFVFLLKNIEH